MTEQNPQVIIIDLNEITIQCCICGRDDMSNWGIPVDSETALIVANDFTGDWGAKPVCRQCWKRHESGEFVGQDTAF